MIAPLQRLLALSVLILAAACTPSGPDAGTALYANLAQGNGALSEPAAVGLVNNYRTNQGLAAVPADPALMAVARAYARDLASEAARGGAIRPDGRLRARLDAAGYPDVPVREAVSAGYYTIAEAFSGWRDSEPHRAAMLLPAAAGIGIAAVTVPGSKYKVYWVLLVAERPRNV